MKFDWNLTKAATNREKHRVSFDEACSVFADPSILTIHDEQHSREEDRWVSMGMSVVGRVLVVVHTWPESDADGDEMVRIISARKANRIELVTYTERRI